jgi:hypothetical protein
MQLFEIKVYDRFDVAFRLAVCQTRKEMLAAIKKQTPVTYDDQPPGDRTMGMFIPTIHFIRGGVPGELFSTVFGTMYLNLADLNDEIIVHECGHAAFAWEFFVRHYTGAFDDDCMGEQEEYCYFLGKASEKVKAVIRKHCKAKGGGA